MQNTTWRAAGMAADRQCFAGLQLRRPPQDQKSGTHPDQARAPRNGTSSSFHVQQLNSGLGTDVSSTRWCCGVCWCWCFRFLFFHASTSLAFIVEDAVCIYLVCTVIGSCGSCDSTLCSIGFAVDLRVLLFAQPGRWHFGKFCAHFRPITVSTVSTVTPKGV